MDTPRRNEVVRERAGAISASSPALKKNMGILSRATGVSDSTKVLDFDQLRRLLVNPVRCVSLCVFVLIGLLRLAF